MQKVAVEDVDVVPHFMGINSERRPVSRAVEEMDFAMVVFELEPGESFSGAPHTHLDHQELFYVLEGTATWELAEGPGAERETVEIGPSELIHFHANDVYQTGSNRSDGVVRAISIGSPGARHGWEGARGLADCPACGEETVHTFVPTEDAADVRMPALEEMVITCTGCGNVLEV